MQDHSYFKIAALHSNCIIVYLYLKKIVCAVSRKRQTQIILLLTNSQYSTYIIQTGYASSISSASAIAAYHNSTQWDRIYFAPNRGNKARLRCAEAKYR